MPSREPAPPMGQAVDINPYAASPVSDARAMVAEPRPEPERHYQVRMNWAARRNFLRAVGPLRVYAVAGMVFGAWGLLGFLPSGYRLWQITQAEGLAAFDLVLRLAFNLAKVAITLNICWLSWKLADAMAKTAGGSTEEMNDWSGLQLRLVRLNVALMAVVAAPLLWDWVTMYFLWNPTFTP
jgi:hypothetical protein